jgi:hypothetical protein
VVSITDSYAVNNDFHRTETIFEVLKDLEVPGLDKVPETQANGTKEITNGATNGVEASA